MKPNYDQPEPPELPPARQEFCGGTIFTSVKNPENVSPEKAAFIRNMDMAGKIAMGLASAAGVLDPLVVVAGLCVILNRMGAPGFRAVDADGLPVDLAEVIRECAQCVTIKTVAGEPPPEGMGQSGPAGTD